MCIIFNVLKKSEKLSYSSMFLQTITLPIDNIFDIRKTKKKLRLIISDVYTNILKLRVDTIAQILVRLDEKFPY